MVKWLHSKKRKATWCAIWLRFMKDLGAYGSWMTQSRDRFDRIINNSMGGFWMECVQNPSMARNIVNDSLFWGETKEGQALWGTLDDAWIETMDIDDFDKEFDENEFSLKLNALSQCFKMKWKRPYTLPIPDNYDESQFK